MLKIQICYTFILVFLCVINVKTQPSCGISSPESVEDCKNYSTPDGMCCHVYAIDTPASFSTCFLVNKTDPIPLINIGHMNYYVNCTNVIPDYKTYYPFMNEYDPCGATHPSVTDDCWASSKGSPCCLAGPSSNFENLAYCYTYPKASNKPGNYTEKNTKGMDLYFYCDSFILRINIFLYFILIILLNM